MSGMAYSLFAGQPLTILGSTRPVLVEYGLSYLSLRNCISLWTAFLCLLLVAMDASSLVPRCATSRASPRRPFASLICGIVIYEALEKLVHLGRHYPFNRNNDLDKFLVRCNVAL
ncbi:hypothetical protein CRUP_022582 [Coryphaenoides rupestris]|nr:hypothetical protein CRUP_022582 [Coryphaenoides rupestris]